MPKIKKKTILILVLVAIGLYFVTEIVPQVIDKVTPTTTIEYGRLTTEDKMTVYLLRDETVYSAIKSGTVDYKFENGVQIKKGTKVLDFTSDASAGKEKAGKDDVSVESSSKYKDEIRSLGKAAKLTNGEKARRKGAFSTSIDGYENYFTIKNFSKMTEDKAKAHDREPVDVRREKVIAKEPMYKITDNSKWYMVCYVDSDKTSRFVQGSRVKVKLPGGEVKCFVDRIEENGDTWKVLLSTNRYCKGFNSIRSAEAKITTLDIEGVLIPNGCITTNRGVVGVYVVQKTGDSKFVPVKTLGRNEELTAVAESYFYDEKGKLFESVNIYDEIIKNPKKVKK